MHDPEGWAASLHFVCKLRRRSPLRRLCATVRQTPGGRLHFLSFCRFIFSGNSNWPNQPRRRKRLRTTLAAGLGQAALLGAIRGRIVLQRVAQEKGTGQPI